MTVVPGAEAYSVEEEDWEEGTELGGDLVVGMEGEEDWEEDWDWEEA